MWSSGLGWARGANRKGRACAPFAGPVYIGVLEGQSLWAMFSRFLRVALSARGPSEVLSVANEAVTRTVISGAGARAATVASSGVSSVSSGATLSLAPSAGREETA